MMLLRHEAGHALNYAYRLYEDGDWDEGVRPVRPAVSRLIPPQPL